MSSLTIRQSSRLRGEVSVPGDKSISHRALILGALASGTNRVRGWLASGDTLATLGAAHTLGLAVERSGDALTFAGGQLKSPSEPIDCANAGTAMRLLAGLLAGQPFSSVLDGSEQLRKRPMRRVAEPLRTMGAAIDDTEGRAPLTIRPSHLKGIEYHLPVPSAQVKSAILLAGLQAEGVTTVIEPAPARDHTERMLSAMGAPVEVSGPRVTITGIRASALQPLNLIVPGDFSSAAFLIVAATLLPESDTQITGVNLNPTRTGLLDILRRMGAQITMEDEGTQSGEPVGILHIKGGSLVGTKAGGEEVVRAIDEVPILAVAASQAEGETMITDAAELRVKEVDRIALLACEMRKLGAEIDERPDGMVIYGPARLRGAQVSSHGDHRLGMALAIAGLLASGDTRVDEADCIADSFPGFAECLIQLGAEVS